MKAVEYISPIRYAFEYFIRNEFNADLLGYDIAETQYGFNLSVGKIIGLFVGYFTGMIILTIILLKFSSKRLDN